jgi:nucleotide-binding universal stress UspA family protein
VLHKRFDIKSPITSDEEMAMIKDIVLNLSLEGEKDTARDFAISVARALDAHLTGVAFAYEPIEVGTIFDGIPEDIIAAERKALVDAATGATQRFDKIIRPSALSAESRVLSATTAGSGEVFGQLARRYDLSIVGQVEPNGGFPQDLIVEGALFQSGRPVLVVPYIQAEPFKLDRILVCWDGSRSASRAIGDALPLLQRAKIVEVVTISAKERDKGEVSGADMAHHLARHRIKVDLKNIVAPDTDVADTILSYVADTSTDLVVMGGYGHSRLREFILGGATRGMLASMTVPTLMSH